MKRPIYYHLNYMTSSLYLAFAGLATIALLPTTGLGQDQDSTDKSIHGNAADGVCMGVYLAVLNEVKVKPEDVVMLTAKAARKFPRCACEVVNAAIDGSKAKAALVVAITEAALNEIPEELWPLVFQCALKNSPESLPSLRRLANRVAAESQQVKGVLSVE